MSPVLKPGAVRAVVRPSRQGGTGYRHRQLLSPETRRRQLLSPETRRRQLFSPETPPPTAPLSGDPPPTAPLSGDPARVPSRTAVRGGGRGGIPTATKLPDIPIICF